MATIGGHKLTFGSCVLLIFVVCRALQSVNTAPVTGGVYREGPKRSVTKDSDTDDIGGVYPVEPKRSTTSDSESGEFVNPGNLQGNYEYDEYPMIVPKRAALLLDRLMVALHHALEEERNDRRRISEIYGRDRTPTFLAKGGSLADFDPTEHENMYSDEEVPDFDLRNLRDLKSPNRGSGETLMAKSFQRRAPHNEDSVSGRSSGRVYWRCYFNAVSCF